MRGELVITEHQHLDHVIWLTPVEGGRVVCNERIVDRNVEDAVSNSTAREHVAALAQVVSVLAIEIAPVRVGPGVDSVGPVAANDSIVAAVTSEGVSSAPTVEIVGTVVSLEPVIALTAEESIAAPFATK